MDMSLIIFGLAFILVWLLINPMVMFLDAVLRRRARARFRKAQRDQGAHHPDMDLQAPVGMDRHRILDDFFKGMR